MAYGSSAYPGASGTIATVAAVATFIPEVWSDEIVAQYKKSLVLANLVKKMSMKGKKGDTIHIPMPTRGSANAKAAATAVTIQQALESERTVSINQHYEYSKLIEDISDIQALSSMRKFYTEDAGYALAKQVDSHLAQLGRIAYTTLTAPTTSLVYNNAYIGGDGTTTYSSASTGNASSLTDAAIRRTIQRLDEADAPMSNRYLVVPPASRNTLMGLSRFTEQAFTGESGSGNTIRNGQIGDVYGVQVFVSNNLDRPTVASGYPNSWVALMFHRDSMVLAEQQAVRVQTQYKQEYLSTLLTADTLYGYNAVRNGTASTAGDYSTMWALVVPA